MSAVEPKAGAAHQEPDDTRQRRQGGSGLPEGAYRMRVETVEAIDEPANAAVVRLLARLREGRSSMSVTWVSLAGRHRTLASRASVRLYYVLSGELTFVLNGGVPATLGTGELLVIPRGCAYGFEGVGTCLVINTPAFEPGDDEYAE